MPAPEHSHRFQRAVLWPYAGVDRYGKVARGTPIEIGVRWETKRTIRTEGDSASRRLNLQFQVTVDREIAPESLLWEGELSEWYSSGNDDTQAITEEVCRVVEYHEIPDLKNRFRKRLVILERFEGAPPPVSA